MGRTDTLGRRHELRYLRTKEGREVDFCLVEEDAPILMIEAKYADAHLATALLAFQKRYQIKGVQVVRHLKRERKEAGMEVRSARSFLESL